MGTDDFHNVSAVYGLDSQIFANCFKAFASYLDIPKKEWNKYHAPYKDIISSVPTRGVEVCTVDRIQENTEGWENDKGIKSGINYDYECIKSFMASDDFHDVSAIYGLDPQILANCFKAFASYLDIPKKEWNKYHAPYKDIVRSEERRVGKEC